MSGLESKWSNLFPSRQVHRGARLSPERAVAPAEPHLHFDIRRSRRDDRIISFAHVALPWPCRPSAIATRRSAGRGATGLAPHSSQHVIPCLARRLGERGAKSAYAMLSSADELLAISREQGFPTWSAAGNCMRGWCLSAMGQADQGIEQLLQGLATWRNTGVNLTTPFLPMTL